MRKILGEVRGDSREEDTAQKNENDGQEHEFIVAYGKLKLKW